LNKLLLLQQKSQSIILFEIIHISQLSLSTDLNDKKMVCKHHSKYENEIKERKEDRVMLKKER